MRVLVVFLEELPNPVSRVFANFESAFSAKSPFSAKKSRF